MKRGVRVKTIGNSRGESMLTALVLLMVFLAVGASVLSAGAASSGASSARIVERQAYYALRSVFDTADAMMKTGSLGLALQNNAYGALVGAEGNAAAIQETSLPFTIALDTPVEKLSDMNGMLVYRGSASAKADTENGDQLQVYVYLTVDLSLNVTYMGKASALTARYRYSGYAVPGVDKLPVWNGEWTLVGVTI